MEILRFWHEEWRTLVDGVIISVVQIEINYFSAIFHCENSYVVLIGCTVFSLECYRFRQPKNFHVNAVNKFIYSTTNIAAYICLFLSQWFTTGFKIYYFYKTIIHETVNFQKYVSVCCCVGLLPLFNFVSQKYTSSR